MEDPGDLLRSNCAVCIDLDGTLLDSMGVLVSTYHDFLETHGKSGSMSEFSSLDGSTIADVVAVLKETHNLEPASTELFDQYMLMLQERYQQCKPMPGADELLSYLKASGTRVALVSSATSFLVDPLLKRLDWTVFFEVVVTGDMVQKNKPAPDCYKCALERLALDPATEPCIAVEDSINGVQSATAANLSVISVNKSVDTPILLVVPDLKSLKAVFESSCYALRETPDPFRIVVVDGEKIYDDDLHKKVDDIWQSSLLKDKNLFDGEILVAHEEVDSAWTCSRTQYRFFYAQLQDRLLQDRLNSSCLSVSGICLAGDAILFGRRSHQTTQYPGFYELVPSGSLSSESIDPSINELQFERQIQIELAEEAGIERDTIVSYKMLGVFEDRLFRTLEVCIQIDVEAAVKNQLLVASDEYDELLWVETEAVGSHLDTFRYLVPTSIAILRAKSFLNR